MQMRQAVANNSNQMKALEPQNPLTPSKPINNNLVQAIDALQSIHANETTRKPLPTIIESPKATSYPSPQDIYLSFQQINHLNNGIIHFHGRLNQMEEEISLLKEENAKLRSALNAYESMMRKNEESENKEACGGEKDYASNPNMRSIRTHKKRNKCIVENKFFVLIREGKTAVEKDIHKIVCDCGIDLEKTKTCDFHANDKKFAAKFFFANG